MKLCRITIGPISGNDGLPHQEGDRIELDDATAELFARNTYVQIIGDIDAPGAVDPEPGAKAAVVEPDLEIDLGDDEDVADKSEAEPVPAAESVAKAEGEESDDSDAKAEDGDVPVKKARSSR